MKGLILCGGLSTRLGEITKDIPKVLLDINGRTVLEHQVAMLAEAGADAVYLASGHLHDQLEAAVGNDVNGMPIHYVREHKRLGTGGAIKHGLSHMKHYPVVVLNGDILLDVSLADMASGLKPEMDGLLLGVQVPDARSYGRIVFNEETKHIDRFVEKDPDHTGEGVINGGVYMFNGSIDKVFPDKEAFSIEYDVFPHAPELYVYPYQGTWIDIGTPERLAFAREHLTL